MIHVSTIICAHNPRSKVLGRVLESLRAQSLPKEQWEFLLVDNGSTEVLACQWDLSWHPNGRHIREDTLGLTPARLRGIEEARGQLLVFVDDDNVLAEDFLERAWRIAELHTHLGAFGAGVLAPEYEIAPPPELAPHLRLLAVRHARSPLWSNHLKDSDCIPWGAGLCVRKEIARAFARLIEGLRATCVIGRRGQELFSGEDDLFSWAAAGNERGFGVFPELRLTHLIAASRLNRAYMLRLIHDHAFSHAVLRYLLTAAASPKAGLLRYIRLLLHGIKNGSFSMRCHWALLQGEVKAAEFIGKNNLHPVDWVKLVSV